MKIISKVKDKISGFKNWQKPGFARGKSLYVLLAIVAILIIISWMLAGRFVLGFGKEHRIEKAISDGQRLEISLTNGNIKGKILKSEEEKPAENSEKVEVPKETTEEPVEEAETVAENTRFDWEDKDFTGPKMPEDLVESLHSGGGATKIVVNNVSIKELSDKPVVIIIIKGMGLSASSTREALELPPEITMGFSPYSPSLDIWMKQVAESKHEVILNIPMETSDYHIDNPGPYSLLTQSTDEDNATRLKMLLNLTKGYNAVYTENSEIFTRSSNNIKPVLDLLKNEGKYFVYGGGYSNYSMIQMADSLGYPILINDLVLDDDISANAINEKLVEMEKIAKEKGYVVVMAHPYPISIRILKGWLAKSEEKGLVVKPISFLLGKVFK